MDVNEALDWLQHDVAVDTRVTVLIDYAELVLGGAEGLGYSDNDRIYLRASILRVLAGTWTEWPQEEGEGPQPGPPSPEERRRAFYTVP
jgi:hypothetical protein